MNAKFFRIPPSLLKARIPLEHTSEELSRVLKSLEVKTFGDLLRISRRALGENPGVRMAAIVEIDDLLGQVAPRAAVPKQNRVRIQWNNRALRRMSSLEPPPETGDAPAQAERPARRRRLDMGFPSGRMQVPQVFRDCPIPAAPLLTRKAAMAVLSTGARRLGDLERMDYESLPRRAALQLHAFLQSLIPMEESPRAAKAAAAAIPPAVLLVDRKIHHLDPGDLPLSTRCARVLKRLGVTRLGDLDGLDRFTIQSARGGRVTFRELDELTKAAAQGAFGPLSDAPLTFPEVLSRADGAIPQITRRALQIMVYRYERGWPLRKCGKKMRISYERIRQVESDAINTILGWAGPAVRSFLRSKTADWLDTLHLTIPDSKCALRRAPAFYVGLLMDLWFRSARDKR